jgi:hypothetical protein
VLVAPPADRSDDLHQPQQGIHPDDGPVSGPFALYRCPTILPEIRNRGVQDVCMVVCDGLKGLPDAIGTVWPQAVTQTCVVHLLRASFRYSGRQDWDKIARALKPVYTAPTAKAAEDRFLDFQEEWGAKYPAIVKLWSDAWAEFTPFLQFDVEIRKVICSTNAIVISSLLSTVFAVRQGPGDRWDRRAGRGYLRYVHHRDRPEDRCWCRGWPRRGRGWSRGRCSGRTTGRLSRSRGSWRF